MGKVAQTLTDDLSNRGLERSLVRRLQCPKLSDGQTLLDGRKHGLDCGRLEQARLLPFTDPDFAQCRRWSELAGNSHQHYVRTGGIVDEPADNDSWPPLGCASVREWEWNEEDGAEVKRASYTSSSGLLQTAANAAALAAAASRASARCCSRKRMKSTKSSTSFKRSSERARIFSIRRSVLAGTVAVPCRS
jgi:hypothetical protein